GITVDEVDHPGGKTGFEEQLDQALPDGRGVLRRLEDAGIALQQARPEHPQRHGKGEVPRRDDGTYAPRFAADEGVLLGDLRGDDVAGRHAAGAEDVLHHVQALDDLGAALGNDLAALTRHQPGEVVGFLLDDLGEVVEQFGTVDAAAASPGGIGGAGGGDGLLGVSGGAPREEAKDLVEAGGIAALEVRTGRGLPVSGDEV